jgi:hypothetical protein
MQEIAEAPDRVNAVYVVRFQPLPGRDPIRSLRAALKFALRASGLRAIECREEPPGKAARASS